VQLLPTMARFVHEIPVRFADTDAQGRVFFANYFTYFDEAMTGYLHAIGFPPSRAAEAGVDFVYVDAQCSYGGAAAFEDRVLVQFSVTRMGTTSLHAKVEARVGDEPIASGALVYVVVSAEDHQKTAIPQDLRHAVERFERLD
jgi:acyl-CoA thioester hydrolase